jgi:hypothetical protein
MGHLPLRFPTHVGGRILNLAIRAYDVYSRDTIFTFLCHHHSSLYLSSEFHLLLLVFSVS